MGESGWTIPPRPFYSSRFPLNGSTSPGAGSTSPGTLMVLGRYCSSRKSVTKQTSRSGSTALVLRTTILDTWVARPALPSLKVSWSKLPNSSSTALGTSSTSPLPGRTFDQSRKLSLWWRFGMFSWFFRGWKAWVRVIELSGPNCSCLQSSKSSIRPNMSNFLGKMKINQ
jgi:hypothetical protein